MYVRNTTPTLGFPTGFTWGAAASAYPDEFAARPGQIPDGCDVRGFFARCLVDNFEPQQDAGKVAATNEVATQQGGALGTALIGSRSAFRLPVPPGRTDLQSRRG